MAEDMRREVQVGDVVELRLRFIVHSVEQVPRSEFYPGFTSFTHINGEPRPNGTPAEFTAEVPDNMGQITIVKGGE